MGSPAAWPPDGVLLTKGDAPADDRAVFTGGSDTRETLGGGPSASSSTGGASSAAMASRMVAKRSAGSFEIDLKTALSTCSGQLPMGFGLSVRIDAATPSAPLSMRQGMWPERIS